MEHTIIGKVENETLVYEIPGLKNYGITKTGKVFRKYLNDERVIQFTELGSFTSSTAHTELSLGGLNRNYISIMMLEIFLDISPISLSDVIFKDGNRRNCALENLACFRYKKFTNSYNQVKNKKALQILKLIESGNFLTIDELVNIIGLPKKSLFAYLTGLRNSGYNIVKGKDKKYYLRDNIIMDFENSKEIPGFPGYRIDSNGNIFSSRKCGGSKKGSGYISDTWKIINKTLYRYPSNINGLLEPVVRLTVNNKHKLLNVKYLMKTLFKSSEDAHRYTFKDGNPDNCSVLNIIPTFEHQLTCAKNRLLSIFKTEDPSSEELSPNEKHNQFIISRMGNSKNKLEDCKIRLHNTIFKKDITSNNNDAFRFLDNFIRFFNTDIASDDRAANKYIPNRIITSKHDEIPTHVYENIRLGGFAYADTDAQVGGCAWLNGFSGYIENTETDNV